MNAVKSSPGCSVVVERSSVVPVPSGSPSSSAQATETVPTRGRKSEASRSSPAVEPGANTESDPSISPTNSGDPVRSKLGETWIVSVCAYVDLRSVPIAWTFAQMSCPRVGVLQLIGLAMHLQPVAVEDRGAAAVPGDDRVSR